MTEEGERPLPVADDADMTLGLVREGYDFIGNRCARLGSDVFETRLFGSPAICMRGAEAAALFYDEERFTRQDAMPSPTLRLLQGEGSVATLDYGPHRVRKAMFMELMSEDRRAGMRTIFARRWRARLCPERPIDEVVLHHEAQRILSESVFEWCGVPLPEERVADATTRLAAMIEGAATLGPRHWRARLGRRREERLLEDLVATLRAEGREDAADHPLNVIARHREEGRRLDPPVAAVELLNLLRPTVAIARYIAFAAHALACHASAADDCRNGDESDVGNFVREVRRLYPFFPMIAARVRRDFTWRGHRFPATRRVLLDLYGTGRHPTLWPEPERFDPGRHVGRTPGPFDLIPQGGGDHWTGHRCAGEWMTIELTAGAVRLLAREMAYDVPPESLTVDHSIPAVPANGFVIRRVRGVAAPAGVG